MNTDKKFEWTDELVKEFIHRAFAPSDPNHAEVNEFMEKFIKSKTEPVNKPLPERIEVSHLWQHDNFMGNGNDAFWYQFCTSKPIEHINNSNIKQAIENVLNDCPPQPAPKTDTVVEDKGDSIDGDYITKLKKELKVTEELLQDRQRLLDAIPECPVHGKCIPYALEWIEKYKQDPSYTKFQVDAIRKETWEAAREFEPNSDALNTFYDIANKLVYPNLNYYLKTLNSLTKNKDTGKDSKEWEIVSFVVKNVDGFNGQIFPKVDGYFGVKDFCVTEEDLLKSSIHDIHSVKRLSDNTVFSVGDIYSGGYKITSFKIMDGVMMYEMNNNDCFYNINVLRPPIPEKTVTDNSDVLFTTEDGVEIMEGDKYWMVDVAFKYSLHDGKWYGTDTREV